MNTIQIATLMTGLMAMTAIPAVAVPPDDDKTTSEAPAQNNVPQPAAAAKAAPEATDAASNADTNSLHLNFRAAPLDMVLNYFSEAAGFIINIKPGTAVRGKVIDAWSNQPLSKEEALNLLDTVLNQNGLAAIRNGKTLTLVNRDEAKTQDIPVALESDFHRIPKSDQIVTQIIPVRFVEVSQLVKDLQPLVSIQNCVMTANEAGNAIVITDTQANIRRIAEIIQDIDMGAEAFTEVKVFRLVNAVPSETADMLASLFPDDSKTGSTQGPVFSRFGGGRFGGFFGGGGPGGGGPGGGGGANANSGNDQRIKKRARVIAVADARTSSVVVSAAKELMEQIAGVIADLDADPSGKQFVTVIPIEHVDPQEAQQVLTDIFHKDNTQNNRNSQTQTSALNSRSTSQNQQNNSSSTRTGLGSNSRGGIGGSSIGP
jgi:general secretion pathway protein D